MGEQYPDSSGEGRTSKSESDDRSYYLVVNLVVDVLDRLAAMLGIGNLETHMQARDMSDQRLVVR